MITNQELSLKIQPVDDEEAISVTARNDGDDFKVAMRVISDGEKVTADISVSFPTKKNLNFVVDEIWSEYTDGNVAVLRFEFIEAEPAIRRYRSYVLGNAFQYVVLMYGQKGGALKLASVKSVQRNKPHAR